MKLTTPGEGGASQLIARLNGKRSLASWLSARGYGAPPPDHGPAPFRAPRRGFASAEGRADTRPARRARSTPRAGPRRWLSAGRPSARLLVAWSAGMYPQVLASLHRVEQDRLRDLGIGYERYGGRCLGELGVELDHEAVGVATAGRPRYNSSMCLRRKRRVAVV